MRSHSRGAVGQGGLSCAGGPRGNLCAGQGYGQARDDSGSDCRSARNEGRDTGCFDDSGSDFKSSSNDGSGDWYGVFESGRSVGV